MSKLKKGLKKAAKAAAIAGAAYGASKMMDAKKADIRDAAKVAYVGGASSRDKAMGSNTRSKPTSIFRKIINMGPGPNATPKMGGTLADKVLSRSGAGLGDMDGAKKGKMIYAKYGKSVMARGCKLGRKKPTKLS
jgi:hypothetical protein